MVLANSLLYGKAFLLCRIETFGNKGFGKFTADGIAVNSISLVTATDGEIEAICAGLFFTVFYWNLCDSVFAAE